MKKETWKTVIQLIVSILTAALTGAVVESLVNRRFGGVQVPVLCPTFFCCPAAEGVVGLAVGTGDDAVLGSADEYTFQWPTELAVGYAECPRHAAAVLLDALEEDVRVLVGVGMCLPRAAVIDGDDEGVKTEQGEVVEQRGGFLLEGDDVGLGDGVHFAVFVHLAVVDVDLVVDESTGVVGIVAHHDPRGILEQSDDGFAIASLLEGCRVVHEPAVGGVALVPHHAVLFDHALDVVVFVVQDVDGGTNQFVATRSSQGHADFALVALLSRSHRNAQHAVVEVVVAGFGIVLFKAVREGLIAQRFGRLGYLCGVGHRGSRVAGGEGLDEQRAVGLFQCGIESAPRLGSGKHQYVAANQDTVGLGHDDCIGIGGGIVAQHHQSGGVLQRGRHVDGSRAASGEFPVLLVIHGIDGKLDLQDFVVHLFIEHVLLARRGAAEQRRQRDSGNIAFLDCFHNVNVLSMSGQKY